MDLVIVNGSNAIARNVVRHVLKQSSLSRVRLVDFRPYRQSVYQFQQQLRLDQPDIHLEKVQVQSAQGLQHSMDGAQKVLYFTHDYLAMTAEKNNVLKATAKLGEKFGVERVVAVCPLEHEMYYSEESRNVLDSRKEAQQEALENMPQNLTLLNTNLVFGQSSYLIHYMTQCAMAGRIQGSIGKSAHFEYHPIHHDDVARAVLQELQAPSDSARFNLNGKNPVTLKQILNLLEQACGKSVNSTKLAGSLGVGQLVEEFFTGVAHDTNMKFMAEFFEEKRFLAQQLLEDDYSQKGFQPQENIEDFYKKQVDEQTLAHPIFSDYKMVSLD